MGFSFLKSFSHGRGGKEEGKEGGKTKREKERGRKRKRNSHNSGMNISTCYQMVDMFLSLFHLFGFSVSLSVSPSVSLSAPFSFFPSLGLIDSICFSSLFLSPSAVPCSVSIGSTGRAAGKATESGRQWRPSLVNSMQHQSELMMSDSRM